jgi:hypothetical protein
MGSGALAADQDARKQHWRQEAADTRGTAMRRHTFYIGISEAVTTVLGVRRNDEPGVWDVREMRRAARISAVLIAGMLVLAGCDTTKDVTQIDWMNQTYAATCWHGQVIQAKMQNGTIAETTPLGVVLQIQVDHGQRTNAGQPAPNIGTGDLTGDGVPEEAVLLDCLYIRPYEKELPAQDLQIHTRGPKLLTHVPAPRMPGHPEWPPGRIQYVFIDSGNLLVDALFDTRGITPFTNPDLQTRFIYHWNGKQFVLIGTQPGLPVIWVQSLQQGG